MAAWPRRAAANHRAPHAPSRPERGQGKVRGGAPSGAAPCRAQFSIPDLVSEAALAFRRPAGKELEPSLPPTEEEPFHSVSLYTCFCLGPWICVQRSIIPLLASWFLFLAKKSWRLLGILVMGVAP